MNALNSTKALNLTVDLDRNNADQRIALPDGRTLAFRIYGDPQGVPVFGFHGTPGSRSMFAPGHEAALRHGVRLIAPDRPGFGLSSSNPLGRFADWPNDVAALADALQIDQFAIAAISGGGPYATACAALLPDRVKAVGLVSPMGPVCPPEGAPVIGSMHHVLFRLISQISLITQAGASMGRMMFQNTPDTIYSAIQQRVPASDRVILSKPEVKRAILATLSEGLFHGGSGAVRDLKLFGEPWDIPFHSIRAPVTLWQGTADTTVPVSAARHLADLIPGCRLIELPGAGHYWIIEHMDDVFDAVKTSYLRNPDRDGLPSAP